MASRLKEDEKNERVIRSLLKLQENRRCINCNSLGPQYVCTNFWTFICTNCSGIHREFTHRVKSVSMAKFTTQEVEALRTGGNKCARQIYLKEWDGHSNPDASNIERLRDFIKHVYVDKRYTGEKGLDKPPRWKMQGGKDDVDETRKSDLYQSGFRSPSHDDNYDRRYSEGSSPGVRSPANERSNLQYRNGRRSSEVVNDWRREDRFGNVKKSEDQKYLREITAQKAPSPVHQRDNASSSPPIARPVREFLGENVTLYVTEPPRVNSSMSFDGSVKAQRSGSSSSFGSNDGLQAELKRDNLIDFDAIPEPTTAAVEVETQSVGVKPGFSSNENWASFESVSEIKAVPQPPVSLNTLDPVFSLLSLQPPYIPQPISSVPSTTEGSSTASSFNPNTAKVFTPAFTTPPYGVNNFTNTTDTRQSASVNVSSQNMTRLGSAWGNQLNPSISSSIRPVRPTQSAQMNQSARNPVHEMNSVISPTHLQGARRELPGDLFSSLYTSANMPYQTWQHGHPQQALGVSPIQYSTTAIANISQPVASPNPFSINEPPAPVHPSVVPSMAGLPVTASFTQNYTSIPTQYPSQPSPFASSLPPQPHFYTPAGAQQVPGIISTLSSERDVGNAVGLGFGSQASSLNRVPSFSRGNPFE